MTKDDEMALDKQIHIYSVDTGAFYNKKEYKLHWQIANLRRRKELIKKRINNTSIEQVEVLNNLSVLKTKLNKKIKYKKELLLTLLNNRVSIQTSVIPRTLKPINLCDKNIISVFQSSLTRTLNIQTNELTNDIIVVKVYYFDLLKDLIVNGFTLNGEKYKYFTSSAGQIRTKKTVFIKECLWDQYEQTLMCGLTLNTINSKGGINVNKYLAYLALINSATDEWEDFDIFKTIVVPDFETNVFGDRKSVV